MRRPVWRWAADSAVAAGFAQIHVVTNDPQIAGSCEAAGWHVHQNPDAGEGLASSIRIAAAVAADNSRLVIALADMPFVEPAHLSALATATGVVFTRQPDGRDGVPAAFPQTALVKLGEAGGDRGTAALGWPAVHRLQPPSTESLFDIDTPADLEQARAIAVRRRTASRQ